MQVLRSTLGKARRQVSEASTMDPLSHRWHKAKGSSKKVACTLQGGITEPFRAISEPPEQPAGANKEGVETVLPHVQKLGVACSAVAGAFLSFLT